MCTLTYSKLPQLGGFTFACQKIAPSNTCMHCRGFRPSWGDGDTCDLYWSLPWWHTCGCCTPVQPFAPKGWKCLFHIRYTLFHITCVPHYLHLVIKFHCVYMLVHNLFVSNLRPLVTEKFFQKNFSRCVWVYCVLQLFVDHIIYIHGSWFCTDSSTMHWWFINGYWC